MLRWACRTHAQRKSPKHAADARRFHGTCGPGPRQLDARRVVHPIRQACPFKAVPWQRLNASLRRLSRVAHPGTPLGRSPRTGPVRRKHASCVQPTRADYARPGSRTTRRRRATTVHHQPRAPHRSGAGFQCLNCGHGLLHQGVKSPRCGFIFEVEANHYREHSMTLSPGAVPVVGAVPQD
jgi:hypothetical protein